MGKRGRVARRRRRAALTMSGDKRRFPRHALPRSSLSGDRSDPGRGRPVRHPLVRARLYRRHLPRLVVRQAPGRHAGALGAGRLADEAGGYRRLRRLVPRSASSSAAASATCFSTTCRASPRTRPRSSRSGTAACRSTAAFSAPSSPWCSSRARGSIPIWSLIDVIAPSVTFGLLLRPARQLHQWRALWPRRPTCPGRIVFPERRARCRATRASFTRRRSKGSSLFFVLRILTHRVHRLAPAGLRPGAFAAGYGVARIFVEFFREPDIQIGYLAGGITMGMLLSIPMIAVGIGVMLWASRRTPGSRRGARVTPLAERLAARIRAERADHRRRLHGRLPGRPGLWLLHAARAVRPRRRFRHRSGDQPDLRRARRRLVRSTSGKPWARPRHSSSPSSDPGRGTLMADALRAARLRPGLHRRGARASGRNEPAPA